MFGRDIIAVDPGPVQSAFVCWDGARVGSHAKIPNDILLNNLRHRRETDDEGRPRDPLVVEMIASYGMAVGAEVFETCVWIGRFLEAYGGGERVFRREVKLHHCHSAKSKDSNVRQALIDRFGPPGTKKAPGLTYGLVADEWQAFALATYAFDKRGGVK